MTPADGVSAAARQAASDAYYAARNAIVRAAETQGGDPRKAPLAWLAQQ